ncbi:cytochrome c biogenesis CcdA family protein [Methanothrix harundinacea]|nr:cytochrome c biogenesis CcdA family protein [Methanothrix harundinacea]
MSPVRTLRRGKGALLALALYLIIASAAAASGSSEAILITSPGCSKCAAAGRVLDEVIGGYPGYTIREEIFYSEEGRRIIRETKAKDMPSIVIGSHVIGYRDYEGDERKLEEMVRSALDGEAAPAPAEEDHDLISLEGVSISSAAAVLAAGLIAGFNPCLLAVLVFLASMTLSRSGRRRDLAVMVGFFCLGIFVMYYLFGLGLFRLFSIPSFEASFRLILTLLLLVLGATQIEDARRLHRGGISLFKAEWALGYFKKSLERYSILSYFLIGALFSLVKAPCVGAVYIAIIGIIQSQGYASAGTVYLLLYNLGVVLPVMILGMVIALGMSPDQVDRFRHEHRVAIRLVTGLTLAGLAPLIWWQIL